MKSVLRSFLVLLVAALIAAPVLAEPDEPGSKDYPGITRMPGYYIRAYKELGFDSHTFTVTVAGKKQEKTVEGHFYEIRYDRPEETPMPSPLQILRNFQNAARGAGGQVLFQDEDTSTIRFNRGGKEVWASVETSNVPSGMMYVLTLVEVETMKQDVTIDASAMARGIAEEGRIALYGIYFDTGKSDLKPESAAAVGEIAKLLKAQPALKVFVVGHTDTVGDAAMNLKLSQARAQSVVNELVTRYQIAAARLSSFGAGPYAPVASNRTEDGRAKNRRVELVDQASR